jgi:hypothetical protein
VPLHCVGWAAPACMCPAVASCRQWWCSRHCPEVGLKCSSNGDSTDSIRNSSRIKFTQRLRGAVGFLGSAFRHVQQGVASGTAGSSETLQCWPMLARENAL